MAIYPIVLRIGAIPVNGTKVVVCLAMQSKTDYNIK
jgi:hypothetical protein